LSELARAESARGELVLRRRDDGALELRVNGVFIVDTLETSSERELARASLATVTAPRRVLVGGLGLGFTLRAVLDDPRVEEVTVVELEPAVVDWLRAGLVPGGAELLADPRLSVLVGDIADHVTRADPAAYDVVLLDVDNGPDFLVHAANADLYRAPFLRRCARVLDRDGVLVVWSMAESQALATGLGDAFGRTWTHPCPVRLGGRDETYWLHLAGHPPGPSPSTAPSALG
jgi:spermidine synthase